MQNVRAMLEHHLDTIPMVRAMQVGVGDIEPSRLQLTAPLSINLNDKGCAFGGSLVSLMTLAGWALVTARLHDAGFIDTTTGWFQGNDVVPRAHDIAAVAGYRQVRGMRKDKTDAGLLTQPQFGHNGREIRAVRAKSVHPDDRELWIFGGFDFDGS